jgi:NAD(P)-dependent dehydrogenase (short-subunit alcohol dehydrogenase family)
MALPSLGLDLDGTHVVVTGGAGLIGSVVVSYFLAAGSRVSSLDITHSPDANTDSKSNPRAIHCDVSDESAVRTAFDAATAAHGPVEVCVALASLDLSVLQHSSFVDASFVQLKRALDVNIAGTWLTAREWLRGIRKARQENKRLKNVNLIIVGSESGHFGERQNVEYSLAKVRFLQTPSRTLLLAVLLRCHHGGIRIGTFSNQVPTPERSSKLKLTEPPSGRARYRAVYFQA